MPRLVCTIPAFLMLALAAAAPPRKEAEFGGKLNVEVPHVKSDASVKVDYDIVYVRAPRAGDKVHKRFYTDIATPVTLEAGADLMLLKADGSEEVLVRGGEGAVTDPSVSFDGEWVFYTLIHTLKGAGPWQPPVKGADIYKIHVPTRRVVRLTHQQFTPNRGAADWSSDFRRPDAGKTHLSYGVLNFGAFPLPGGRVVFTSNRNAFRPPRGYPRVTMQLFVMDDDGKNVECIGHMNIAGALHPVTLRDGRVIFSSLESQGIRSDILWGIWSIHPDGTNWAPVVSAFDPGGAPNAFHFQTQLSDGSIIVEGYYNQNNSGFGTYIKVPEAPPAPKVDVRSYVAPGARAADWFPAFGPAHMPSNKPWRFGRYDNGKGAYYRMPFMPLGSEAITPFVTIQDQPAGLSDLKDRASPRVGKFTHPSGAPDNHLLTVYSPGPVNHQYTHLPQLDGGIYLLKDGKAIDEPAQLRLIKNDPRYNEQWPRALVPYRRIYGVDEPKTIAPVRNDGRRSAHLPEGTPFGLVGTSSLYKRETYPNGLVPRGKVTATYAGGNDPWKGLDPLTSHGNGMPLNWHNQGADAGLYTNEDIHAVRIVAMEPTTDRNRGPRAGRLFASHTKERLRILGEVPVRKVGADGKSPLDPDGNPDTSFLAKIPADVAFTFQTLDREGMVLNMSQTWHQLRPGEVRNDCGGCHAHSQAPTPFEKTAAARPDYKVWDLTERHPVLGDRGEVRYEKEVKSVEYHRDVWPILQRSCVACHTAKGGKAAGGLALDGPDEVHQGVTYPGGYFRLAVDARGKYGHKPVGYDSWGYPQASRYVRALQSRRSLLIWKVYGKRLDGFHNDDHPSETEPGSGKVVWRGKELDAKKVAPRVDIDYVGGAMPPVEAVKSGKVKPLSDEDRRALVRWVDLGCPLDLDHDARRPERRGHGLACDDQRPTLTLTYPAAGRNDELTRLVVGMHDYGSGLDLRSFRVYADFAVNGLEANTDLSGRFQEVRPGTWELRLDRPVRQLKSGAVVVSVQDRQGNVTRVERTFSVGGADGDGAEAIRKAVTFYASFDEGVKGDFGGGELAASTRYPDPKAKGKFLVEKGVPGPALRIAKGKGVAGGALECTDVLPKGGWAFFPVKGNLAYRKGGWAGGVSLWVKTDADRMIKSPFCDPIQITDKRYNDGAIWFDFNDKKPRRDLRMGTFPAVPAGKKAVGEDDPKVPLVWARQVGWKADDWHHVVMTWRNFDTGKADAQATLYIDGRRIGSVKDQAIAMGWDEAQARVFFSLGYVGLLDELALFNRELTEAEVKALHKAPGLLSGRKKGAGEGGGGRPPAAAPSPLLAGPGGLTTGSCTGRTGSPATGGRPGCGRCCG